MSQFAMNNRPLVVVVGDPPQSGRYDQADEQRPPVWWHIDAMAVALARAALARRVRIAVPFDEAFGPLLAQVAAEYLAPRLAEKEPGHMSRDSREPEVLPVTFFDHSGSSRSARRSGPPAWARLSFAMGVASLDVMPLRVVLENERPIAAVTVGSGRSVTHVRTEAHASGVPVWQFGGITLPVSAQHADFPSIEADLEAKLTSLRERLHLYWPFVGEDSQHPEEGPIEPRLFRYCPPYVVHAQAFVAKLFHTHEREGGGLT